MFLSVCFNFLVDNTHSVSISVLFFLLFFPVPCYLERNIVQISPMIGYHQRRRLVIGSVVMMGKGSDFSVLVVIPR